MMVSRQIRRKVASGDKRGMFGPRLLRNKPVRLQTWISDVIDIFHEPCLLQCVMQCNARPGQTESTSTEERGGGGKSKANCHSPSESHTVVHPHPQETVLWDFFLLKTFGSLDRYG